MACAVRPAGWAGTTRRVGDGKDHWMNEHLIEVCESPEAGRSLAPSGDWKALSLGHGKWRSWRRRRIKP